MPLPPDDIAAEAQHLVDRAPLRAAEAALAAARAALAKARDTAAEADREHHAAREAFAALVDAGAAGKVATFNAVNAAHERVAATERYACYLAAVAGRMAGPVETAEADLAEARHVAWSPVAEHGIGLRIAAARKADRVTTLHTASGAETATGRAAADAARSQAIAALRPDWDRGTAFVDLAMRSGFRRVPVPGLGWQEWPARETHERLFWRRPATAEEMADAAA